jgi:hypothetical protein
LKRAIDRNQNKNFPLSAEELGVYHSMNSTLSPLLAQVDNLLDDNVAEQKIIRVELKNLLQSFSELQGKLGNVENTAVESIVERTSQRLNLTEDKKEQLREGLIAKQKDTNWLFENFGNLVHAQNAYLNVAGDIISKTYTESRFGHLPIAKDFLNKLDKLGFLPERAKEFKKGNYFESIHDFEKIEKDALAKRTALYNALLPKAEELTPEQYNEAAKKGTLKLFDEATQNKLYDDFRQWEEETYKELMFSKDVMDERRSRLEGFSDITVSFERNMSIAYSQIMRDVEKDEKNRPIMTKEIKSQIEDERKKRANVKSIYDADGTPKAGLEISAKQGVESFELSPGVYLNIDRTKAQEDGILAFELHKLDSNFQAKTKTISDDFVARLEELEREDVQQALDFLYLNSYMGFSEQYYESIQGRDSIVDKLVSARGTSVNQLEIDQSFAM